MRRSRPLAFIASSVAVTPLAAEAFAAGDVNDEGVTALGAGWYAVTFAGNRISTQQPSSGGNAGSGGGYGC
jgi:hypothetical protein